MEFRTRAAAHDPRASGRRADRVGVVAVVAVAILAGAVIWGPMIAGEPVDDPVIRDAVVPLAGARPGAGEVVVAGGAVSTLGLISRRMQSFPADGLAAAGPGRLVGAHDDLTVAMAAAGPASAARWVAVRRSGAGLLVRVDARGAVSRVVSTGDLAPRRIAVLPGRVVVMGDSRVAGVPTGTAPAWSRALPSAVDVAVGYQSVWTLSRLPGARSLLARREPATGRVTGRRTVPTAATRLAVGLGAVWIANGCANGVLRAPVGGGAGTCVRVGRDPADVAVGAGAAWAADASGGRIVEMEGDTARIVRTWALDGRPSAVDAAGDVVAVVSRGGRAFALARGDAGPADSGGRR
jgi:hypothetical protein